MSVAFNATATIEYETVTGETRVVLAADRKLGHLGFGTDMPAETFKRLEAIGVVTRVEDEPAAPAAAPKKVKKAKVAAVEPLVSAEAEAELAADQDDFFE